MTYLAAAKVNELYFFSVSPVRRSFARRDALCSHRADSSDIAPLSIIIVVAECACVRVLLDRTASHNENAYISSFDFAQTTVERSRQREQSGVDGPISWRLNGKAMKYKYRTPGSVLSCFNRFLILLTCFRVSIRPSRYASRRSKKTPSFP